jgi:hypothetical protein
MRCGEALARRALRSHRRVRLRTFKGQGVQPGVNLDSNAALLDLMEGTVPKRRNTNVTRDGWKRPPTAMKHSRWRAWCEGLLFAS